MKLVKVLVLVGIVALAVPQIAAAADTKNDIGIVVEVRVNAPRRRPLRRAVRTVETPLEARKVRHVHVAVEVKVTAQRAKPHRVGNDHVAHRGRRVVQPHAAGRARREEAFRRRVARPDRAPGGARRPVGVREGTAGRRASHAAPPRGDRQALPWLRPPAASAQGALRRLRAPAGPLTPLPTGRLGRDDFSVLRSPVRGYW